MRSPPLPPPAPSRIPPKGIGAEEVLAEMEEILNTIESDTKNVTRAQYREFLHDLQSSIEMRLDGLGPEQEDEG